MRILMTADTVGGVWTYALVLAAGLQRHGVEVVLAVMGAPASAAQRAEAAGTSDVTLAEAAFRLEWMPEPWDDLAAAGEWLLQLEQDVRPDVVHLNGYVHAALPWTAPVMIVAHSCVLSWWRAVHGCDAPAEWRRYAAAVRAGVQAADAVVAPTRAMLHSVTQLYGDVRTGRVIPNGCAPALKDDADAAPGRDCPVPGGGPFVLAAGRAWDGSKNLRVLAEAAAGLAWPVFVAGSCEHPAGGSIDLPGVHTLGVLPPATMRRWYEAAPIFVHPAVYEPFGLAPLEAALAGAALVLADIPSLREVWGDAAVFVPPRDASALTDAVNSLATDPLLLSRRAAAARQRADTLSVRRMADAYHDLYRDLRRRHDPAGSTAGAGAHACA
jgi:glycogen synthase